MDGVFGLSFVYNTNRPETHGVDRDWRKIAFADFEPAQLARIVERTAAALPPGACPVWMGSNHDLGRFPSRDRARTPMPGDGSPVTSPARA